MVEKQEKIGEFLFRSIGANHIIIFPHPTIYTDSLITMTGSAVTKYIQIPYLHRIVKLVLIHLTSAYAKASTALSVKMELEAARSEISKYFDDMLFQAADVAEAEIIEMFGDGFEYEPRTWTLTLTGTNTDLVLPVLYIQKLDDRRP